MAEFCSSPEDIRLGEEYYVRYLAGVAIIHNPVEQQALHGMEVDDQTIEPIAVHAERLMYESVKNVIRCANSPDIRSSMNRMEESYQGALPNLLTIMDSAYERHAERIDSMGAGFNVLRPLVVREEPVYRQVCHSRLGKLSTVRFMDGVTVHETMAGLLEKRYLTHLSAGKAKD